ncbi:MAG: tetratricopeptide repeat protein [Muribaculaceae bacterium]|nr:tetratricopeptide repeat protein [Muribaculaceae bacterium]
MKRLLYIIMLLMLTVTTVMAVTAVPDDERARKEKAQYVYMESLNARQRGDMGAHYDLLERAYELDSTNTAIAYYYGLCRLSRSGITLRDAESALEMMRKHIDASPDDYYETIFYADAARSLRKHDLALDALKQLWKHYPYKPEVQSRLADEYAMTGDYANAVAVYDSIEALQGMSLELTSRKVMAYSALQDTMRVINEMHRLLATAPKNASYNMVMGSVMQQLGMADSALYYLDAAQEYEPDNGYTHLAKAQFYYERGDSAQYDNQIYKALINENLDLDAKMGVLTDYTRRLLQSNDSSERVNRLFRVLIEQHPHESEIHELYSEYFVVKKDYKAAAEQLGYVLDIDRTDADAWRKLMLVNMMGENYPAAVAAAEHALAYNPDSIELYRYVAPAYLEMKEYDKALATYDQALGMVDSTDLTTRSVLVGGKGDVYFSRGDSAQAFKCYDEAIELNPSNYGILNNYAYFLAESDKELDKAESMAARAVNANPQNSTFIDTYAWVFYKKGDYKMALLYIRSALNNDDGENEELVEHYGDILWMDGSHDEAVEQWKKALEMEPEDAEALKRKIEQGL